MDGVHLVELCLLVVRHILDFQKTQFASSRPNPDHKGVVEKLKFSLQAIHKTVANKATTIPPFSKLRSRWPNNMVFSETNFLNTSAVRMQYFCGENPNFILVYKVSSL